MRSIYIRDLIDCFKEGLWKPGMNLGQVGNLKTIAQWSGVDASRVCTNQNVWVAESRCSGILLLRITHMIMANLGDTILADLILPQRRGGTEQRRRDWQ